MGKRQTDRNNVSTEKDSYPDLVKRLKGSVSFIHNDVDYKKIIIEERLLRFEKKSKA